MKPQVRIEWDLEREQYVVSDEDGEFARAVDWHGAKQYVADLVVGPGTLRDGGLARRTRDAFAEEQK